MNRKPARSSVPSAAATLTARAARLKSLLVKDAVRHFAAELRPLLSRMTPSGYTSDQARIIDDFLFNHRLPDGRRLLDWFLAQHPELPAADRALVEGWHGHVLGVFRLLDRDGDWLDAHDEVADLDHRFALDPNADTSAFHRGMFIIGRAVPAGDVWLWSGSQTGLADEDAACATAAELALRVPRCFFRNPAHLAAGRAEDAAQQVFFIARFGSPCLAGTAAEVQAWCNDFHAAWNAHKRAEAGLDGSPDGLAAARTDLGMTDAVHMELPQSLHDCRSVGIVFAPVGGMGFVPEYGDLLAAFADPTRLDERRIRDTVRGLLAEDTVSPEAFTQPGERWPEGASAVMRRLVGPSSFDWSRDGEALLRRYKPGAFETLPLPGTLQLRPTLVRALVASRQARAGGQPGA